MSSAAMNIKTKKSSAMDMTTGSIPKLLVFFAFPLILGNLFQQLYNTVDVLVVGNFVGKEALAAVGSTSNIINMLVMFFNGVSIGAGVVISQYFGAHDEDGIHRAVETTMVVTAFCCVLMTLIGVGMTPFMLRLMATPDDVIASSTTYLRIYFGGVAGLLIYNMGSGILRAVGDTRRPLICLCCSSVTNIVLDLIFVVVFHWGIAGVAYATIMSQFGSAMLVLYFLMSTDDIYRFSLKDLCFDWSIMKRVLVIGLPAGIQAAITSFSNVVVQSYINAFGATVMAGWSCYIKIDQFVILPMQSMSMAVTTFVGQNTGARNIRRAKRGTYTGLGIAIAITACIIIPLQIFAHPIMSMFTQDEQVIGVGIQLMRWCLSFLWLASFNQVLSGALRGAGDSKTPMYILLASFVVFRQIYLFVITKFINTMIVVCFGYPAGWIVCSLLLIFYYQLSGWDKKLEAKQQEEAQIEA